MSNVHDKFIIEGTLELLSGLHIGAGRMTVDTDAAVVKDANDNPYIPGSSLKGVLRTLSERFHHLVLPPEGTPVCFLADDDCNKKEEVRKQIERYMKEKRENEIEALIAQKVCPVCQLYGSQFRASKLIVCDSFLQGKDEGKGKKLTTVRHSVAIDRDTGAAKDGAKYDYEVVHKGLQFSFRIEGEQLNKQDERLLWIALLQLASGRVHLGGKVSRGLGRVQLKDIRLYTYNLSCGEGRKAYLQFLLDSKHRTEQTFDEWTNCLFPSLGQ
ncbi:type III CRISPR-associated RAMP protein Csx7 [Geobacillus zalihae]|uniref:type III CRISPR-associated RAMP protein Csx7 n=1 Tax=Geobacillus zalihae TaxID=213419 RepID=UPI001680D56A|nr:CRISPR-associated RAMP protein Csx7 [Geobacillus zalihae]QNU24354.1 CRISPR-associated RAMP protein [Geobacillus zalihae]